MTVTITEFTRPDSHTHPDWVDNRALSNELQRSLFGSEEWVSDPAEDFAAEAADTTRPTRRWLARDPAGRALGSGLLTWSIHDPQDAAIGGVYVTPAARNTGIGTRLADAVLAAAEGLRPRLVTYVMAPWIPQADAQTLPDPSGPGGVPADDPGVRFARARGMRLGQIERIGRLPLTSDVEALQSAYAAAEAVAGPDYRVHLFEDGVPEERAAEMAALIAAMSTDVPAGELDIQAQDWDGARVIEQYQIHASTHRILLAVAEHVPSGSFVAYNELASSRALPEKPLHQWDTLVTRAHRGHRLGMLVKGANLLRARRAVPEAPAVVTFNATDNTHMLAVNEALGFTTVLAEGAFQLDL